MSMPTLRRLSRGGIGVNTVALAAFLHVAVLIAFLLPRAPKPEPDGVAIELVQSDADAPMLQLAAATPAATPETTPAPPQPIPEPTSNLPPPAPEPVTTAEPIKFAEPEPEPAIRRVYGATANIITRDQVSSVTTTGDTTLPPQLAGYRNQPPQYPAEAERRRLEGEVRVLIRVRSDGVPAAVELVGSSGIPMLDRAAVDTLLTWRFAPGRVAASFPFNIRFVLGDHR